MRLILDPSNCNLNVNFNLPWVIDGLKHGTLRAVCDESYKPKLNEKSITTA